MNNLYQVKAGNMVILHREVEKDRRVIEVKRVTKTRIVIDACSGPPYFRKSDGRPLSWTKEHPGWSSGNRISVPQAGEIVVIYKAEERKYLIWQIVCASQETHLDDMSYSKLERIKKALRS